MKSDSVIEKIKTRVAAVDPNGPRKVLGVIQLNITTDDGTVNNWICDLKELKVIEGSSDSADVTLDIDDETFFQIGTRSMAFGDAEASGKAKVSGDRGLVCALQDVLK